MARLAAERPMWSRWVAATLLVPGALVAVWASLEFGGVESMAAEERTLAAQLATRVEEDIRRRIASLEPATRDGVLSIARAPDGSYSLPFVSAPPNGDEETTDLAIQTGLVHAARREFAEAARFLEHARSRSALDPAGILALARCRAELGDSVAARELLAAAPVNSRDEWLDGLTFVTLVRLLDARLAARTGNTVIADSALTDLVSGDLPVPVSAVDAVADSLTASTGRPPRNDVLDAIVVARAARMLGDGAWPAPSEPAPGPLDTTLVPRDDRLLVLGPRYTGNLVGAACAMEVSAGWTVVTGEHPGALAERQLLGTGSTISIAPAGTLPSERLRLLARGLLGLALIAFLVGNLLLHRVAKREIALSSLKGNFINVVSHELRTPLTALSMKAEMLAHGDVPPARIRNYQLALYGDVVRLTELVNRILDFARLERGGVPLQPRPIAVRDLLARAIRAGRDALRLGGQRLHVEAARDLPGLCVDDELIARALRNVIENATRLSPRASTIGLAARLSNRAIELTVSDEGPGLGGIDGQALFEPFRRGAHTSTDGSGLGLAIVRQAVEAHGGSVMARNRPEGRGAVFSIRLPLEESA